MQAQKTSNGSRPYALLRAGYPYYATLGMRRVTQNPVDIAFGDDGILYVLCRQRGIGNNLRRINWEDEDLGTIGGGNFEWPVTLLRDSDGAFFISDEAKHQVIMLDPKGDLIKAWGTHGSEPGELNRPSGMAFDADENIYVSDTLNHRIQKFSKDGRFESAFGSLGDADGQLNMPWGVAVDDEGMILVSDWRNDRIQRFTPGWGPPDELRQFGKRQRATQPAGRHRSGLPRRHLRGRPGKQSNPVVRPERPLRAAVQGRGDVVEDRQDLHPEQRIGLEGPGNRQHGAGKEICVAHIGANRS